MEIDENNKLLILYAQQGNVENVTSLLDLNFNYDTLLLN